MLLQDEPRPGIPRGRIPNSTNIPITEVIHNQAFLDDELLEEFFSRKLGRNWRERPLILTCGSGVTAAIVGLAMKKCGASNWTLYDGSWAEYGTTDGVPKDPKGTQ